jgi:hypothetical protein
MELIPYLEAPRLQLLKLLSFTLLPFYLKGEGQLNRLGGKVGAPQNRDWTRWRSEHS